MSPVRTAVILAAGRGTRLGAMGREHPKGFIRLGDRPIIEESIARLLLAGIEEIIIVTGHLSEFYEELADAYRGVVRTMHNPEYARSGSMYSLSLAAPLLGGDFILLESDLIYEQRAVDAAQRFAGPNVVMLSGPTGGGDEAYVETDTAGNLRAMSKNRAAIGTVAGELVGISRIGSALFQQMMDWSNARFAKTLMVEYEFDAMIGAAQVIPVQTFRIDDLMWSEIDDEAQLSRARREIYPKLDVPP